MGRNSSWLIAADRFFVKSVLVKFALLKFHLSQCNTKSAMIKTDQNRIQHLLEEVDHET